MVRSRPLRWRRLRWRGRRWVAKALVGALWSLCVSTCGRSVRAGSFDVNDTTWQGCTELLELLRRELGADRVVLRSVLDWEAVRGTDAVLVMHPAHPIDADEAASFMKAGGRLAIVDDFGRGDELLAHFKIRRRGLPTAPATALRGNPALAIATPALDATAGDVLGVHPTVADVKQVVLNHGTGLEHPNLTPVLEVRALDGPPVAVAVAGQIEGPHVKGRLFAMGDPSVFINLMLRYPGNRVFARGLVHYLADGDATGPRHGRLYIVANAFDERGAFGGETPFHKAAERQLRRALQAVTTLRDEGFPWWLHWLVAAVLALALLRLAYRSLVRLYRATRPRFARATPLVAQAGVAGRVAVLISPVSPPALALLELQSALTEALSETLGLPAKSRTSELVAEAARRGALSSGLLERAGGMLGSMRAAETAVIAGEAATVTRAEVISAASVVDELVEAVGVDVPWPLGSTSR